MEKYEYQIVYGKNVTDLLFNVQKQLENGFYPHGSLVYVDNYINTEINEAKVSSGFYQPMVKENVTEFIGDFIE